MVFSSLTFMCLFLPVCLGLYFLFRSIQAKNIVLLVMSLFFYAWGEPKWIILLILTTLIDYICGIYIEKYRDKPGLSKAFMISAVAITLGFLGIFKYLNFFTENVNGLFGLSIPKMPFGLPIGISFYTFQALSYVIDVYNRNTQVQRSFPKLLLYVSMFPQLIAGPIVRYVDVAREIEDRKTTLEDFSYGVTRFLTGLAKKALIANFAGQIATNLFGGDLRNLSVFSGWLGLFGYFIQIYFDFSGYSDMAIGLGRILGFKYLENFNYPYISKSIKEFWGRWHISLSSFFRDYLYIPLGGNRTHHTRNMLIVWCLTGLWHGASWNYVLWGLYYFVFLMIEKLFLSDVLKRLPSVVCHIYSLLIIAIGWVFFYFEDLVELKFMLKLLFGFAGQPVFLETDKIMFVNNLPFIIIAVIACTPIAQYFKAGLIKLQEKSNSGKILLNTSVLAYDAIVLFLCIAALVGSSYNPFLYFRF